ncbi:MAG: hypothetical protein ACOYJF_11610 [Prevotella sp.]
MKKYFLAPLFLAAFVMPLQAQTEVNEKKNLPNTFNKIWNKTKTGVKKTGRNVGEFLGFDTDQEEDLVEIDGVEYMPLYTHNLFYADSTRMLRLCERDLLRRYPTAKILHTAIPQTTWTETALKKGSKIVAYRRHAYCYVLASDGNDGYINARYSFQCERKPGKKWVVESGQWPKFERADAIPNVHYQQLNKTNE